MGIVHPNGGFCVLLSQEKAKPAVRQGRKITGLIGDSRVALKRVVRHTRPDYWRVPKKNYLSPQS